MNSINASSIKVNPLNKRVYELAARIAKYYDAVPSGVYLLLKYIATQKDFEFTYLITDCPKALLRNWREVLVLEADKAFNHNGPIAIQHLRSLAMGKYSLTCGLGDFRLNNRMTFSYLYYNHLPDEEMQFFDLTGQSFDVPESDGLERWLELVEAELDELDEEEE